MTNPVPTDPIGLIRPSGLPGPTGAPKSLDSNGKEFENVLRDQLEAVNALSVRAEQAQEDFAAGKRSDLESVVEQTREADAAVRMVVQVRNQLLEAIEEIKQVRP